MEQKIALFDYQVTSTNPIGGCHRRMLEGLCHDHQFTVFAVEFDNPCPERIRWVRIPAPKRPLALLFLAYHLLAPIAYGIDRVRRRSRFDLIQFVESNLAFGDVAYAQFCHRTFLSEHWSQVKTGGLRGRLRWLDHALHARLEPLVYRRVKSIVVPSRGLQRELEREYPFTQTAIRVIPNPVDLERMRPPDGFARDDWRQQQGIAADEIALVFTALGHFERKGLPLVLEALAALREPRLKLVVVGGQPNAVAAYRERAAQLGLDDAVRFVGLQRDVRPYLWAADAFVFPSSYESFSLSIHEAAAAGMPIVVTPLNGVEELLRDGENGILIGRSTDGVAAGLTRLLALSPAERRAMGERAQHDVQCNATDNFVAAWRDFYTDLREQREQHVVE